MSAALEAARAALRGERAWVVGGAVRDRLMGRPVDDLDLVVDGDVRGAARHLALQVGGPRFPLGDAFGAWRVIGPDRAWQVDLAPLRGGTIEADLALRDFTVNAIAEPLAGGPLIDPHEGAEDVRRRRLHLVSARAFPDDPLRTVRLVRLAVELGLEPDRIAQDAAREHAPRAATVAGERVFAELRRIMASPRAVEGLELLGQVGLEAVLLPELAAGRGMAQNRFHDRDVHGHVLAAVQAAIDLGADPEPAVGSALAPAVRELLAEPLADDLDRGGALRWAALLHDIAKPPTCARLADGRVTFIGHDRLGADMARAVLTRLRASERLRGYVAALTRHHLHLGFLVHERPLGRRAIHRYLMATDPVPADVTLLTVADRLATRGDNAGPAIAGHLDVVRTVLPDALAHQRDPAGEPLVRGDDLAAELGIRRGPRLGELLAEIAEARFAGEVATREDAVAYARGLLAPAGR